MFRTKPMGAYTRWHLTGKCHESSPGAWHYWCLFHVFKAFKKNTKDYLTQNAAEALNDFRTVVYTRHDPCGHMQLSLAKWKQISAGFSKYTEKQWETNIRHWALASPPQKTRQCGHIAMLKHSYKTQVMHNKHKWNTQCICLLCDSNPYPNMSLHSFYIDISSSYLEIHFKSLESMWKYLLSFLCNFVDEPSFPSHNISPALQLKFIQINSFQWIKGEFSISTSTQK